MAKNLGATNMELLRGEFFRNVVLAVLAGIGATLLIGWLLVGLGDSTSTIDVERSYRFGVRDGRADGYEDASAAGRSAAVAVGVRASVDLFAEASFDDGYAVGFEQGWNGSLQTAINLARASLLGLVDALDEWETLLRGWGLTDAIVADRGAQP